MCNLPMREAGARRVSTAQVTRLRAMGSAEQQGGMFSMHKKEIYE